MQIELNTKEKVILKNFLVGHIVPCNNCNPDLECDKYKNGDCVAKNL